MKVFAPDLTGFYNLLGLQESSKKFAKPHLSFFKKKSTIQSGFKCHRLRNPGFPVGSKRKQKSHRVDIIGVIPQFGFLGLTEWRRVFDFARDDALDLFGILRKTRLHVFDIVIKLIENARDRRGVAPVSLIVRKPLSSSLKLLIRKTALL